MRLEFAGTRGEIERRSRRHRRHSVLAVEFRRRRVLVDCGIDWRGRLAELHADAIVLTHAHHDHAGGLRDGATVPVYATAETWRLLARYPLSQRQTIEPRRTFVVHGIEFEAFPVEHSLRAPAVAYRISAGRTTIFYAPDVATILHRDAALHDLSLYVGDGASIRRPIVRRRNGARIGHASIREQLEWCAAEHVRRAIFSHCGSQIVRDEERGAEQVALLGREHGVAAAIAHDGLRLEPPRRPSARSSPRTRTQPLPAAQVAAGR